MVCNFDEDPHAQAALYPSARFHGLARPAPGHPRFETRAEAKQHLLAAFEAFLDDGFDETERLCRELGWQPAPVKRDH